MTHSILGARLCCFRCVIGAGVSFRRVLALEFQCVIKAGYLSNSTSLVFASNRA